jgi:hypothetical protein
MKKELKRNLSRKKKKTQRNLLIMKTRVRRKNP